MTEPRSTSNHKADTSVVDESAEASALILTESPVLNQDRISNRHDDSTFWPVIVNGVDLHAEIQQLRTKNTELERKLTECSAKTPRKYQPRKSKTETLEAQSLRALSGAVVSADDHDTIRAIASKAFSEVGQFAENWCKLNHEIGETVSLEAPFGIDRDLILRVATPRALIILKNHSKVLQLLLETLLNHFLCEEIVLRPFALLDHLECAESGAQQQIQRLFESFSKGCPAKGVQASSMFMKCLGLDSLGRSKFAKKFKTMVEEAKEKYKAYLTKLFQESEAWKVIKNISQSEEATLKTRLGSLLGAVIDFTIYIHKQGFFVECVGFGTLVRDKFSITCKTHEGRAMEAHVVSIRDWASEGALVGQSLHLLVRPHIILRGGRGDATFKEAHTILPSIWWFPPTLEKDSDDSTQRITRSKGQKQQAALQEIVSRSQSTTQKRRASEMSAADFYPVKFPRQEKLPDIPTHTESAERVHDSSEDQLSQTTETTEDNLFESSILQQICSSGLSGGAPRGSVEPRGMFTNCQTDKNTVDLTTAGRMTEIRIPVSATSRDQLSQFRSPIDSSSHPVDDTTVLGSPSDADERVTAQEKPFQEGSKSQEQKIEESPTSEFQAQSPEFKDSLEAGDDWVSAREAIRSPFQDDGDKPDASNVAVNEESKHSMEKETAEKTREGQDESEDDEEWGNERFERPVD